MIFRVKQQLVHYIFSRAISNIFIGIYDECHDQTRKSEYILCADKFF